MQSIKFCPIFFLVIFFQCHLFSQSTVVTFDKPEYELMDVLALEAGTDKSSSFHNYTKVYSQYFKHCKDEPINFLEIGIYKGNSVKFWENYFSKADLHFIDITNKLIEYYSNRSKYHYIDQSHQQKLERFAAENGPFDIIIDDGGHTMIQQINSFAALFNSVKPGGLYIIEDLHTSYWKVYGGSGNNEKANEGTAVGFLKDLIDHVNFPGAATACANTNKIPENIKSQMNYLREHIESIHFYTSVCIIQKK